MSRPHYRIVATGLLLVVASLMLRAFVPNAEKGGADFFIGALMGAGLALEAVALWLGRPTSSPGG